MAALLLIHICITGSNSGDAADCEVRQRNGERYSGAVFRLRVWEDGSRRSATRLQSTDLVYHREVGICIRAWL